MIYCMYSWLIKRKTKPKYKTAHGDISIYKMIQPKVKACQILTAVIKASVIYPLTGFRNSTFILCNCLDIVHVHCNRKLGDQQIAHQIYLNILSMIFAINFISQWRKNPNILGFKFEYFFFIFNIQIFVNRILIQSKMASTIHPS